MWSQPVKVINERYWRSSLSLGQTFSFLLICLHYLFTLSNLLLEPKPKMSRCPWESVAAKCCPSGLHLQSNSAPWPWPSICTQAEEEETPGHMLCSPACVHRCKLFLFVSAPTRPKFAHFVSNLGPSHGVQCEATLPLWSAPQSEGVNAQWLASFGTVVLLVYSQWPPLL